MKFQDKFYDVIDHNKYPSSEKSAEKCILMNSYFHHSEPRYNLRFVFSDVGPGTGRAENGEICLYNQIDMVIVTYSVTEPKNLIHILI